MANWKRTWGRGTSQSQRQLGAGLRERRVVRQYKADCGDLATLSALWNVGRMEMEN